MADPHNNQASADDKAQKTYTQMFDECFDVGVDACIEVVKRYGYTHDDYTKALTNSIISYLGQLKKPST